MVRRQKKLPLGMAHRLQFRAMVKIRLKKPPLGMAHRLQVTVKRKKKVLPAMVRRQKKLPLGMAHRLQFRAMVNPKSKASQGKQQERIKLNNCKEI
jgi:hypothetical protein